MTTYRWHLHGHHFWDLGSGPGDYNELLSATNGSSAGNVTHYLNLVDPLFRDSTTLYPYSNAFDTATNATSAGRACGWRVVRFEADGNPGLWNMVYRYLGVSQHVCQ